MTTYVFSLCEFCLRKLFHQFKISPKIYDSMDGTSYSLEEDQKDYEVTEWRRAGGDQKSI